MPLSLLVSPHFFTLNVFIMNVLCHVSCINQQLTAVDVTATNSRVTFIFILWRAQLSGLNAFKQLSVWTCEMLFYLPSVSKASLFSIWSQHVFMDLFKGLPQIFLLRCQSKPGHICHSAMTIWWHCSFTTWYWGRCYRLRYGLLLFIAVLYHYSERMK